MRTCKGCSGQKPLTEFPTYKTRGRVGYRRTCQSCWTPWPRTRHAPRVRARVHLCLMCGTPFTATRSTKQCCTLACVGKRNKWLEREERRLALTEQHGDFVGHQMQFTRKPTGVLDFDPLSLKAA
jgi:hypothetical protein